MPVGAAIGITGLIAAGVSAKGAHDANKSQKESSNQAIDLAREQEAERKREWDIQQGAAKQQWEVAQANARWQWDQQQAQLAPYRAARESVLARYGIKGAAAPESMPEGYGGVPSTFSGATPEVTAGQGRPGPTGGGGAGWLALGAGIGGVGAGLASYLQRRPGQQAPSYTTSVAGVPGGPPGPPSALAGVIDPSSLSSWADWTQYGVPGQSYQGE